MNDDKEHTCYLLGHHVIFYLSTFQSIAKKTQRLTYVCEREYDTFCAEQIKCNYYRNSLSLSFWVKKAFIFRSLLMMIYVNSKR